MSLRGHDVAFYGRGNLGFEFLGGASRRVLAPPRLSEIATRHAFGSRLQLTFVAGNDSRGVKARLLRSFHFLARTDRDNAKIWVVGVFT